MDAATPPVVVAIFSILVLVVLWYAVLSAQGGMRTRDGYVVVAVRFW